ncbi:MAG: lysine-epsilon-oxidase maturase LodB [Nostoc sp. ChiQUE02]|uniref:lysine-epsilon-oxidase maturase LodB n=1 Tax=Nostoc sp. ChiQUE02 TaxID=3075377 RepID=UPI002AD4C640|nr:lysine-epsilon-oxidase maturase LodB [Nostoc sp. ChiQUE02]MDZ8228717.1 lysine-epsilon-oxidase maturase LodB [Nostoc sp. ChiQUE02]
MQLTESVDIAIIGGGPAGTALALTLCLYSKLTVAVIERTAYNDIRIGEHVSASLLPLLDYLHVKDLFLADNHLPVYNVAAVWGTSFIHTRNSIFNQMGEGYLLKRGEFDAMLAEQVFHHGGQLYLQTKCEEGEQLAGGGWQLSLCDNSGQRHRLEARYLVDATGRQAKIAKRLGANSVTYDRLVGICGLIDFQDNKSKAEEIIVESVSEGWWYSAWLPDGYLIATLMTDVDIMQQQRLHKEQAWSRMLAKTNYTRQRAAGGSLVYPLTVKTAYSHILDCAVGDDWLAVGDAATAFDPLSSMGIGHAIASGCNVGVALIEHFNHQGRLLVEYQSRLEANFETYLKMRRSYYEIETRWTQAPFWQRRATLIPCSV